jgi:CxxC-x17-CxxC domain-containing protein
MMGKGKINMEKEKSASFEEFSKNRKVSGRGSSRGSGRGSGRSSSRGSDRSFNRNSGSRQNVEMTKVTCSTCKAECEVPFKPTSSKPVYCNDCFMKKGSQGKVSKEDLDTINGKLKKIIKLLENIEH